MTSEAVKSAEVTIDGESSATSVFGQNELLLLAPEEETPSAPGEEYLATPTQPATPAQERLSSLVQERPSTPAEECPATPAQEIQSTLAQERPATPNQEAVDEEYFPDYEHASPMRLTEQNPMENADLMTTQHMREDKTEDAAHQAGALMNDTKIPDLQDSMAQLSLQNEYKLAAEDEDELTYNTSPVHETILVMTPMAAAISPRRPDPNEDGFPFPSSVDAAQIYTPRHNITESADLCIPDYDIGTMAGVSIIRQDDTKVVEAEVVEDEQLTTHDLSGESSNAAQRFEALFQIATESASTEVASITDILVRAPELNLGSTVTSTETAQAPGKDVEDNAESFLDAQVTEVSRERASGEREARPASEAPTCQTSQVKQKSAIAALHTPPRPIKSNKAVTKSTFQLPGEVIAAKLKAQREERKKKEESNQDQRPRKDAVVRPVLKSAMTADSVMTTTRARSSVQSDTLKGGSSTVKGRMAADRTARPSMPARGTSTAPRTMYPSRPPHIGASTLTSRNKPAAPTNEALKRPAALRTSTAPSRPSLPNRKSTAPAPAQSATTTADTATRVHATGADVFNRPMVRRALEEKAAKEKVEAQKRARAEAAERSRQMSREFAERKKGGGKSVGGTRNVSGESKGVVVAEVGKDDARVAVVVEGTVEAC